VSGLFYDLLMRSIYGGLDPKEPLRPFEPKPYPLRALKGIPPPNVEGLFYGLLMRPSHRFRVEIFRPIERSMRLGGD